MTTDYQTSYDLIPLSTLLLPSILPFSPLPLSPLSLFPLLFPPPISLPRLFFFPLYFLLSSLRLSSRSLRLILPSSLSLQPPLSHLLYPPSFLILLFISFESLSTTCPSLVPTYNTHTQTHTACLLMHLHSLVSQGRD